MEQKRKWKLPSIEMRITKSAVTDTNPYLFVWNRFLDTMIGIIIGIGVNCFSLLKEKRKDILFISGLDDTLLHKKDNLRKSPYRNYVKREFQSEEGVVYFMMLYPSEIIEGFYKKLEQQGFTKT